MLMPLFHVYGNMCTNAALVGHYPLALVPNPRDLDDLIATIEKERPAMLHGVPSLFIALLNHPKVQAGKADFTSLKVCYSAAAPLMAETKHRFEALTGGRLLEAYALTESMLAAVVSPVRGAYKEGSTGIPVPDVVVRIADADTGEGSLPAGQVGEVLMRAPNLMAGYWERPTETANMIRGGWLYTGDVIKASGFQVWPREVEEVIATHPAVAEVSVAGVPDERHGEAVKAWIVLREGQQATADEIRAYCRERMAGYKVPRHVEFRTTLPKTMVGKVLRRVLTQEEGGQPSR
jgi:long-chain acyl-CoA synthetase